MSKLIIHNETDIPDTSVVENYILPVMKEGKISELTTGQKQYCFATVFKSGVAVECTTNKTGTTDTFKVLYNKNETIEEGERVKEKLVYNVLLHDFNRDKIIKYNVLSGDYITGQIKKACNNKTVTTYEELKEFARRKFMAQYWSRTEYEILVSGLHTRIEPQKIDAWYQIEMNLDLILEYLIDKLKLDIKR